MPAFLSTLQFNFAPNFSKKMYENTKEIPFKNYGEVLINNWTEHFYISEQLWTIQEYELQWNKAWTHLQTNTSTLFITNIQISNFMLIVWPVYKKEEFLLIQNHLLIKESAHPILGNLKFNPKNSLFHIPKRRIHTDDGMKISEWIVTPTPEERKVLNM